MKSNFSPFVICAVLFLYFHSCSSSENVSIDSALYEGNTTSAVDTTFMENCSIFTFEETPNSLFSRVDRVLKNNGIYYLLDQSMKQVILYDSLGAHINTIHKVGNGLGEYASIRDIAIDKDEKQLLILVDPSAILFYSLEGKYEKTLRLKINYNSIGASSEYIYLSQSTFVNNELSNNSITIIKKENNEMTDVLKSLFETAPYCYIKGMPISFTGDVLFTRRFDNTIYSIDQFEVKPCYVIDWQKRTFPEDMKKETFKCQDLNKLCKDNEYVYSITDIQEGSEYLMFRTNLPGVNVMSKQHRKVRSYDFIMNSIMNTPLPNYLPVGGTDGEVFFVYPAQMLPMLKEQITRLSISNETMTRIESMTEESNPLIFRYVVR